MHQILRKTIYKFYFFLRKVSKVGNLEMKWRLLDKVSHQQKPRVYARPHSQSYRGVPISSNSQSKKIVIRFIGTLSVDSQLCVEGWGFILVDDANKNTIYSLDGRNAASMILAVRDTNPYLPDKSIISTSEVAEGTHIADINENTLTITLTSSRKLKKNRKRVYGYLSK